MIGSASCYRSPVSSFNNLTFNNLTFNLTFNNLTLSPDIITPFSLLLKLSKVPLLFYIGLVLFVPDPLSNKNFSLRRLYLFPKLRAFTKLSVLLIHGNAAILANRIPAQNARI